jgi:hypothetical protein
MLEAKYSVIPPNGLATKPLGCTSNRNIMKLEGSLGSQKLKKKKTFYKNSIYFELLVHF